MQPNSKFAPEAARNMERFEKAEQLELEPRVCAPTFLPRPANLKRRDDKPLPLAGILAA